MNKKSCGYLNLEFSTAGFLPCPESGREVMSVNVGWRFCRGAADGAAAEQFDDSGWELVNLPHGLEILPFEASGGVNYQGKAWYRKRFKVEAGLAGQRIVLHFEGLMGKSCFHVNGKRLKEHFGGYLPCVLDVSHAVRCGGDNVIAVCVDNSDDPSYPPGKPQAALDFAYFGGIYRDVWMVTTPGWQFWNEDPLFEQRVFSDIRNMVRRDRNRPSVLMWEPILNETNYPAHFAEAVHRITHAEYPYTGCWTACDREAKGQEHFEVVYGHIHSCDNVWAKTGENLREHAMDYAGERRCVFTREWGDCPADWRAQSSPSRVPRGWGEHAQLVQARHYADPDYVFGCNYETLCAAPPQHVGGTLWHGTDHQRGYHADAFWGGILDAARQPKYSYYLFKSQVSPETRIPHVNTEPFVYIAHLMHPTSDEDVTVFSNCEQVRLRCNGEVVDCKPTHPAGTSMPRHPVVFDGAFRFRRHGKKGQCLEAEGVIGGAVVATATRRTWDRRHKLVLEADLCGIALQADGGDFVPVVARIVDEYGEVVRLTDDTIRFSVEGPAELIGGDIPGINPQKLCWGEAVVLVRAGVEAGRVTIRAASAHPGAFKPLAAEMAIETLTPSPRRVFSERRVLGGMPRRESPDQRNMADPEGQVTRLAAVEQQQEDFMNRGSRPGPVKSSMAEV